ncbi:murein biosynthesis integral membrane protein MurJ [Pseudomarimonas arenosa]|uniref:Murein biosynthesis integral membrane protein MurJ n=1 Tax=Pseudomarimonas arenosa TaxID=2774145 RepID=A0AAW3ZH16_9GAMM|nr:murein biosynthesis integral membrane protein MurJ [Pseudomarimonas arenosa]MBD8524839.1 murein biosynthesis integral membrane protein MurJ [Pseudomarimonas arenosa]
MSKANLGGALTLSVVGGSGKLLAILKTMLIAALFGASAELDAFWVAYSLPMLLPALLSTVITVAFVPRFMASLEGKQGHDDWRGANTLFTVILLLSLLVSVLFFVHAEWLVNALAPGLAEAKRGEAARLTRILLPCVPLLTLSSLLSAICNARERFVLPALEGVLTNITVIAAAWWLAQRLGISALIIGVLSGFLLQAAILLWGCRDLLRSSLRPALDFRHADFTGSAGHLLPLLVGSAGAVATSLINQYFLSHGAEGAISAMAYASMFAFLPLEVFAQSVITTFYPSFGRHFARAEYAEAAQRYREGLRLVLFLTLPCAVLLALFAEPIMVLLLERGSFTAEDTRLTARITVLLTLGLVFRSVAFFNYRVLHAALQPWRQVLIGLLGIATHMALCLQWVDQHGAAGVALAASLSMLQSALLSAALASRALRLQWQRSQLAELAHLLGLALLLAAAAWWSLPWLWAEPDQQRWQQALMAVTGGALIGLATLVVAVLTGQPDVNWLKQRVLRRR